MDVHPRLEDSRISTHRSRVLATGLAAAAAAGVAGHRLVPGPNRPIRPIARRYMSAASLTAARDREHRTPDHPDQEDRPALPDAA